MVRVRQGGATTDVYLNLLADGSIMHHSANLVLGGLALYSISVFMHAVFGLDLNLRIVILAATERLCILFRDTLLAGDEGYRAAPGLACKGTG
jgi:hypothetical protein